MFYTYFLKKPKFKYIYIGFSNDLQRRIKQHKQDKPGYKLIYYEAYLSEKDARERERHLKKIWFHFGASQKKIIQYSGSNLERAGFSPSLSKT